MKDGGIAKLEIVATDFGFTVSRDAIPPGEVSTSLVNEGKEPHQAGYYKLRDGVTYDEYVEAVLEDDANIPAMSSGGRAGVMRMVAPGDRYTRPSDELEPGLYALVCSIRDPETGKNHFELGMMAPVTVE